MVNETKYGVISDIHRAPRIVIPAIEILKKLGAEKLILNGDIGNSQGFVAFVLNIAGESELETFVQPGSHEKIEDFEPVIEHFKGKYPNLINVIENRKIEQNGHHLVFMPGSDFRCGGEYVLNRADVESGLYKTEEGIIRLTNTRDLKRLVTSPDKTIVICHVPRKFDNLETSIDMAQFGEATKDFNLQGDMINTGSVFPEAIAKQIIEEGYPVQIKRENRGNVDLRDIYEELGIKKAVSGHFHESGHRANNRASQHVTEGELVEELFWNSGYLDAGQTGILTVEDGKVSYKNIRLQDYLE